MRQLTIESKVYTLPERWEDITIQKQLLAEKLIKENPDFQSLAIISGYVGIGIDELKRMNIYDVKQLLSAVDFTKVPLKAEPLAEFEYKGDKYFVMPTLLKAEFQDFLSVETALDNYKEKALPYIVAVLAKKENESLNDFNLDQRAKHFNDLPITIANNICSFFLSIEKMYMIDSRKVLALQDKEIRALTTCMLNILKKQKYGGWYSALQKVMLRSYLKSLLRNWNDYYFGYSLETKKQNWIERLMQFWKRKRNGN